MCGGLHRLSLAFALSISCAACSGNSLNAPSPAPTPAWQTTFNCNEWDQSVGLNADQFNCDGMSGYGAWATSGHPAGDQITAAANNPAGGGGRGFRHWRGDGTNTGGGGFSIHPSIAFTEMWIRFYMRYQAGFTWSPLNYTKELYLHSGNLYTLGFHGGNSFGVSIVSPSTNLFGPIGWQSVMGGSASDGLFHCYEVHVKSGASGIAESWIDGALVHSNLNLNWGSNSAWEDVEVGDNQASPSNGGDMYTDYDDLAIGGSGRIGCVLDAGR